MATQTTAKTGQAVIRAFRPGVELRATQDGGMPTLFGHFAVFNRWAEIDSWFEGHFLERIAPGAFKKTFRERTPKVLFQHGMDPQIGDKPLGPLDQLREDTEGGYYEVPLLDTAYNRELIPGLEAGLYGASFRFKVMREEIVDQPDPSDDNPSGLPERTIKEAQVMELGPVTFPAYDSATAGIRSLTDRFLFDALERDPSRARELLESPARLQQIVAAMRQDPEPDEPEPDDEQNDEQNDEQEHEDDQAGRSEPGRTPRISTPSSTSTPAESGRRASVDTSETERREPVKKTWQQVLSEEDEGEWIPRI